MSRTMEQRIKYIQNLNLGHSNAVRRTVPFQSEAEAAVCAGSIVSFMENMSSQQKADVLNSTLLAQLAASKRCSRQKQYKEWYNEYKNVLEMIGWNVQMPDLHEIRNVNTYSTVDNLVTELATAYLAGEELELFKDTIDGLEQTDNELSLKLFDSSCKDGNAVTFQLGVARSAENILLKTQWCSYKAEKDIGSALFFEFGSQKISFYAGDQTMVLNEDVYAQVRDAVLGKLGKTANDLIKTIEL